MASSTPPASGPAPAPATTLASPRVRRATSWGRWIAACSLVIAVVAVITFGIIGRIAGHSSGTSPTSSRAGANTTTTSTPVEGGREWAATPPPAHAANTSDDRQDDHDANAGNTDDGQTKHWLAPWLLSGDWQTDVEAYPYTYVGLLVLGLLV